jgi:type IV secretory pathway TraG/TraD family ATPase VirD4
MPPEITSDLYGSAVLETKVTWPIKGLFHKDGYEGFPLGHTPEDRNLGLHFDLHLLSGHGIFIGATRAGKFVNLIAPALMTLNTSCVITDPKGESAWVTGPRREALGHRVVNLDPWGEIQRRYGDKTGVTVPVAKFNPLSSLDPKHPDFNDDIAAIADALIIPTGDTQNSHWTDSARELISGLIAAVVEENPGVASMRDVRELITASDEELITEIERIRKDNPRSLAARKLRRFAPKPNSGGNVVMSDEISSIRSTAETQTAIFDSETLLNSMETDAVPFDLAELVTGKVTLYLVLPPDRLTTHGRWLRMILTLVIRTISRIGNSGEMPVCLFIDEMGTMGPLRMIEDSYGLMAGLGVRIFGFLQDLSQLQRDYPKSWETFISNSSVIQLLQCADQNTADYFSKYLGTATVNAKTGGVSLKQKQYSNPNEYYAMLHNRAKELFKKHMLTHNRTEVKDETADKIIGLDVHSDKREIDLKPETRQSRTWAIENAERLLKESGYNELSYTKWEPDTELASRAIMLPQEIRTADMSKSIIVVPNLGNFQLTRYIYYSDPVMSNWARHDPNKPKPEQPKAQAAAAPAGPAKPPRPALGTIPRRPATPEETAMWGPRFDTVTGQQIW